MRAALADLSETDKAIMINSGNDYSFAYADDIVNVPLSSNDYYIVDETIPFYEMLIHGYIDYAGSPINLSDSFEEADIVLNLIENGAAPHFVFSWKNSNEIKNTALNRFYSTSYTNWKQEAIKIYNQVNDALNPVKDAAMVNHAILNNGVKAVTYDNGVVIYINPNTSDQKADGFTIPARSYLVGGVK